MNTNKHLELKDIILQLKDDFKFNSNTYEIQLTYLKELFEYEETRQNTLDNKLSQLLGQSSIVFSLISLFIPLFYSEFLVLSLFYKILLLAPFVMSLLMFMYSIYYSTKLLDPKKDIYATGTPSTVTKNHDTKEEFIEEQIKDLFFIILNNSYTNTMKVRKIINSQKYLRLGLLFFGVLALLMCITIFTFDESIESTLSSICI